MVQLSCGPGIQMREQVQQPEKRLKDKEKKLSSLKCNPRCSFSVSLVLLNIDSGEIGLWRPRMFMSCAQELEYVFPHIRAQHRDTVSLERGQEWRGTSFVFPVRCRTLLLRSQQTVQGTNPDVEFVSGKAQLVSQVLPCNDPLGAEGSAHHLHSHFQCKV